MLNDDSLPLSFVVEAVPVSKEYHVFSTHSLNLLGQQLINLISPQRTVQMSLSDVTQHAADLCQQKWPQQSYFIIGENVLKQVNTNIPQQPILPYLPNTSENILSSSEWQKPAQIPSQIVTIIQCKSEFGSGADRAQSSPRQPRRIVRLLVNSTQYNGMDSLIDLVNEALLEEPNTIKTLWNTQGMKITDPLDLLRQGRLYFASTNERITLEELHITDQELRIINRLERLRLKLNQQTNFVTKPIINEQVQIQSRKSTPYAANVSAQAYNEIETFPEVFLRHYTVGEPLGDGRFSSVYECKDKATGIQLALKIIDKERCKGYEFLIDNELAILRRVKHSNIIKLVEEFQNEMKYFLVFEYVPSGDLLTAISAMTKYSEHDSALMVYQIASALKYLHSLNIVHRDVKLENILITNHPDRSVTLKLADLGLALTLSEDQQIKQNSLPVATTILEPDENEMDKPPMTSESNRSKAICGTPMYIAPEVIQKREYSVENDIWSLGIITFTLLSGMAPFDGENDEAIMLNIVTKDIDFSLLPKVSTECKDALQAMLERDPKKRISASELLQHSWIKRETGQRRVTDSSGNAEGGGRRRKPLNVNQPPLLTFSSVDHRHPIQGTNMGGGLGGIEDI